MLIRVDSHIKDKPAGRIRQQNEKKIMEAAEMEFALHGYKGASIQDIAQRAGIPKANVHYYFGSKLELYAAVLSNILELWDSTLSELKAEDDPAEALPSYIRAKMELSRQYPLASRIFGIEVMNGAEHLKDYFQHEYVEWFNGRTAVFKAWMQQGKMDEMDPAHLMFLLWSSTQHYADFASQIRAALGKGEMELGQQDFAIATETLTRIVLKGCGIQSR